MRKKTVEWNGDGVSCVKANVTSLRLVRACISQRVKAVCEKKEYGKYSQIARIWTWNIAIKWEIVNGREGDRGRDRSREGRRTEGKEKKANAEVF